jgi:hypothetical protein
MDLLTIILITFNCINHNVRSLLFSPQRETGENSTTMIPAAGVNPARTDRFRTKVLL